MRWLSLLLVLALSAALPAGATAPEPSQADHAASSDATGEDSGDNGSGAAEVAAEMIAVDLSPVRGRTAAAISDDAVIVGGGGVAGTPRSTLVTMPPPPLTPVHDVWMLGADGRPSRLPRLPAEGMVGRLSGVEIDETIVLAGVVCQPQGWLTESCGNPPYQPVVWTKTADSDVWEDHPLPDDMLPAVPAAEHPARFVVHVLGAHDGRMVMSIHARNSTFTHYVTFGPLAESFDLRNVARRRQLYGHQPDSQLPECLHHNGTIFQVGLEHSARYVGEVRIRIGHLYPTGERTEIVADINAPITGAVANLQIRCADREEPHVFFSQLSDSDIDGSLRFTYRLAKFDVVDRSLTEVKSFVYGLSGVGGHLRIEGYLAGKVVISGDSTPGDDSYRRVLYTFSEEDGFSLIQGVTVDERESVFFYGDYVGVADDVDGEGEVRLYRVET